MNSSPVKIHLLPGGILPERKTAGAGAFDIFARAIVSPDEMDPQRPFLRKTLFDFENNEAMELDYRLEPDESVLVGIGFVTEMEFPLTYKICRRSGLSSKRIMVMNNDTIIDSDYRGEAGVLLQNRSDDSFLLKKGMRIAQIKFEFAVIPDLIEIFSYNELSQTERGAKGFGSTGIK